MDYALPAAGRGRRRKSRSAAGLVPTEHVEQRNLFEWAGRMLRTYPVLEWLYAVPNGGHRNIIVAKKLKAEGVKPGVPDVVLPVRGYDPDGSAYGGLYIELKRLEGGRVSPEQTRWHEFLRSQAYRVEVCRGWLEASAVIATYLEHGRPHEWRDGRLVQRPA